LRRTWVVDYRLSVGNHPGKVDFPGAAFANPDSFFRLSGLLCQGPQLQSFPSAGSAVPPSIRILSGFPPSSFFPVTFRLFSLRLYGSQPLPATASGRCAVPKSGISFLCFTGRSYFCPGLSSVGILLFRAGTGWFLNELKNAGRTDPLPFALALGQAFLQHPAGASVDRQEEPKFHCFSSRCPALVDGRVVAQRINDVFNCGSGGSCRFPAEDLPQRPARQMIRFQYHSHWMGDSRFPTRPWPLSEESGLPLGPTRAQQK